jgi:hypothetical protein
MHVHICTQAHSGLQGCMQMHMPAHSKCMNSCNYAQKTTQIHRSLHKHRHMGNMAIHAHRYICIHAYTHITWLYNFGSKHKDVCSQSMYVYPQVTTSLHFCKYKCTNSCSGPPNTGHKCEDGSPWAPYTLSASSSGSLKTISSCFCAQRSLSPGCFSRAFLAAS